LPADFICRDYGTLVTPGVPCYFVSTRIPQHTLIYPNLLQTVRTPSFGYSPAATVFLFLTSLSLVICVPRSSFAPFSSPQRPRFCPLVLLMTALSRPPLTFPVFFDSPCCSCDPLPPTMTLFRVHVPPGFPRSHQLFSFFLGGEDKRSQFVNHGVLTIQFSILGHFGPPWDRLFCLD